MPTRVHVFYSGNVQGVYFRATAERIAQGRAVTGWVRNLPDGRVELLAEGERAALEDVLGAIERAKAPNIRDADAHWLEATGEFRGFVIRK